MGEQDRPTQQELHVLGTRFGEVVQIALKDKAPLTSLEIATVVAGLHGYLIDVNEL